MINKPQIVYPNNQAIDSSIENTFSFVFNGDELSSYQIRVLDSITLSPVYVGIKTTTKAYNGDTINADIPASSFINGKNYLWNVTLWQPTINIFVVSGIVLSGSSTTSIKIRQHPQIKADMYLSIDGETKKIKNYDFASGTATTDAFSKAPTTNATYQIVSDFITGTNFFFKTRNMPVLNIKPIPDFILTRKFKFEATYSQQQNTPIKYHIWNIYSTDTLLDTTEQVYSSNLSYEFDGLLSDQYYFIEIIVVNQDDVQLVKKERFVVFYETPNINVPPKVTVLENKNAVLLDWVSDKQSIGTATEGENSWEIVENYPFEGTNSVWIKKGQIYYDTISGRPIDISNYSVSMSTSLDNNFQGKIVEFDNHYIELVFYDFIENKNGYINKLKSLYTFLKSGQQPVVIPEKDTGYVWKDSDIWNDDFYWVETNNDMSKRQWKIIMMPHITILEEVNYNAE